MGVILKNNAVSTITTAISASDVGLAVAAGTGTLFPTLGASDYFYATLVSAGGTYEVIKVTARVGDTMTIVRAQEGTTAQSFASGSRIELRVTAASITDMVDEHDQASEIVLTPSGYTTADDVQEGFDNLGSSGGSTKVGFLQAGSGAVARTAQSKMRDVVSVKDFGAVGDGVTDDTAAIQAAVAAADFANVQLEWGNGVYRATSALAFSLSRMNWVSQGATILLDPLSDIPLGVSITLTAGVQHIVTGSGLEVDANGKCNGAIQFLQPLGTQTTDILLEQVKAKNVQMYAAAAAGSFGVSVRGGFNQVKLVDCGAENIMMRSGAGVVGTRGVTGIVVRNNFGVTGAYPANVIIERPTVRRVYSQDATYQFDMDGIGIFANPSDSTYGPSTAEIHSPDISGCWGRDIKVQNSACRVTDPKSVRDEGPTGGINFPAIDFQTGPGRGSGGLFVVDGVTAQSCVGFQMDRAGVPASSRWDGGSVSVIGGGALTCFNFNDSIGGALTKFVTSVSNVDVNGTMQNFSQFRTNGFDAHTLKLDGVTCTSLTESLVRATAGPGGSGPYRLRVYTKNCINLGSTVPTVKCNIAGVSADVLLDDYNGIGFGPDDVFLSGSDTDLTNVSMRSSAAMPIPLNNGLNSGSQKMYSAVIDASAEITLPAHGFNSAYLAEIMMGVNRNSHAKLAVDLNGINSVDVGSAASIGTTADPGSGDLRIWRSSGTNQLVIKNGNASARMVMIRFFG